MLVTTEVLARHLDDPGWIVFDTRHDLMDPAKGPGAYAAGHIPGAYFMHEWKTTGGETRQAGVTELHSAETKADLAAKILAESDPALKPIADQLLQMNHTDNVQFYNSGAHSGFNADFWQGQLQDARASYGMPDLAENPNSSESKG